VILFWASADLQRPHCDQCRVAIADYECQRCVQRFCKPCELVVHHRLEALALKHEESKGDGRPHQEFLKLISGAFHWGVLKRMGDFDLRY
jgi:hypothetical protein